MSVWNCVQAYSTFVSVYATKKKALIESAYWVLQKVVYLVGAIFTNEIRLGILLPRAI